MSWTTLASNDISRLAQGQISTTTRNSSGGSAIFSPGCEEYILAEIAHRAQKHQHFTALSGGTSVKENRVRVTLSVVESSQFGNGYELEGLCLLL